LPMRGARRSTLLQMRENDLNYVRIGGIRDHPQRATAQRTDCASRSKGLGIDM
jgi:hypothetical protein